MNAKSRPQLDLHSLLGDIVMTLDYPEDIDIDPAWVRWVSKKKRPPRNVKHAIHNVTRLQSLIHNAWEAVKRLPPSDLRADIDTALTVAWDTLGQVEVPASWYVDDGMPEEGVRCIVDAVQRARERVGEPIRWLGARLTTTQATPETVTMIANEQDAPNLTDREYQILLALKSTAANSEATRQNLESLVGQIDDTLYAKSIQPQASNLKRLGYISANRGRGAGYWITTSGCKISIPCRIHLQIPSKR